MIGEERRGGEKIGEKIGEEDRRGEEERRKERKLTEQSKRFGSREVRILILGLDAAGKTTILYALKLKQRAPSQVTPTVGFNVEQVVYRNIRFNVWDVGGQEEFRPLWRHYYAGTDGFVFVVDSSDLSRMPLARRELQRILQDDEMCGVPLVVFANKQDILGAAKPSQVEEELQLSQFDDRAWCVVPCCALAGRGLTEGLTWLAEKIPDKRGAG